MSRVKRKKKRKTFFLFKNRTFRRLFFVVVHMYRMEIENNPA
jgi:hypothetical protein